MLEPERCPKFHACPAAVCPLDARLALHRPGEPICYYLRASRKTKAGERFADDPIFAACVARLDEITDRYPEIRRKVDAASRSGFRGENLTNSTQQMAGSSALLRG